MTPPKVVLGPRFQEGLTYAVEAHRHQGRKGHGVPYLGHLLGTTAIALTYGADEDEAIAAVLHDAAEDQGGRPRLEDIRKRFGDRVAGIVEGCSDTFDSPKPPWEERKEAYLARLREAPPSVLLVVASDKLDNLRSTLADLADEGDTVWARFTRGKEQQVWYYSRATEVLAEASKEHSHHDGLRRLVDELQRTKEELVRRVGTGAG